MTDHYFNALEYAHQLEDAGVPAAQAEVHANTLARVLDQFLFSAADSASLKSELLSRISESEARLRNEILSKISESEARLRNEIKEAVAGLRADLTERIDRLETRMNWMVGILVASQLTLFAMVAGLYLR
jgi:hypothetical protein